MKIKIAIFFSCFGVAFISLHAQKAKPSFGITAGSAFSTYKTFVDNGHSTSNLKAGLTAGVTSSFSFGKHFSFQPALNFTQEGGKEKENPETLTFTFNYVELPLNFIYRTSTGTSGFFIGGGPSLATAVSGKGKVSGGGVDASANIKFGNGDDDDFKAFNAGINVLSGYSFKGGIFIAANYTFGISNLFNDNQSTFKMNYFALKLGYLFGN